MPGMCEDMGAGTPETVWFELSLIGHVTSLRPVFSSLKPEARLEGGGGRERGIFVSLFLHLNAVRLWSHHFHVSTAPFSSSYMTLPSLSPEDV